MLFKVHFDENKATNAEKGTEEKELEWSNELDRDLTHGLKIWKGKNLKEYKAIFVEADDEADAIKEAQEIADRSSSSNNS